MAAIHEKELDAEPETVVGEMEVGHASTKQKAEGDGPELKRIFGRYGYL